MEKPVIGQLVCALVSIGGGIGFGVVYDFFKALRLKIKNVIFAAVTDIAVCVLGLSILFLLFMSIGGGEARLYIALCAVIGALLYFITASAVLLLFFTDIISAISKLLHIMVKPLKLLIKNLKNLVKNAKMFFQNTCKRFTILKQGKAGDKTGGLEKPREMKKEHDHEAQTRKSNNKNRHSRPRAVRGDNAVLTKRTNRRGADKAR